MAICINCDKAFKAKRSDAQLCSAKCRQQFKRKGNKLRGQTAPFKGIIPSIEDNRAPVNILAPYVPLKTNEEVLLGRILNGPPVKSFRDYMDLIKTGQYNRIEITKWINEDKKLNSNQKSMLYSKLN